MFPKNPVNTESSQGYGRGKAHAHPNAHAHAEAVFPANRFHCRSPFTHLHSRMICLYIISRCLSRGKNNLYHISKDGPREKRRPSSAFYDPDGPREAALSASQDHMKIVLKLSEIILRPFQIILKLFPSSVLGHVRDIGGGHQTVHAAAGGDGHAQERKTENKKDHGHGADPAPDLTQRNRPPSPFFPEYPGISTGRTGR